MRYVIKDADLLTEPRRLRKIWIALGLCVLGIAIGIALRIVSSLDLGIVAHILSGLKTLGIAIWGMIRDVAGAIGAAWDYVRGVRQ